MNTQKIAGTWYHGSVNTVDSCQTGPVRGAPSSPAGSLGMFRKRDITVATAAVARATA